MIGKCTIYFRDEKKRLDHPINAYINRLFSSSHWLRAFGLIGLPLKWNTDRGKKSMPIKKANISILNEFQTWILDGHCNDRKICYLNSVHMFK